MKVIVAGLPKTGTKSMNAALTLLGYEVYDWLENFWYLGDDWVRQIRGGFKVEDMKRMYKNVDAVMDNPCCIHWEEIFDAFPDTKVILTIRDEDNWYRSLKNQFDIVNNDVMFKLMLTITLTGCRLRRFLIEAVQVYSNSKEAWVGQGFQLRHKEAIIKLIRRHERLVKQVVPKNQLLVYEVKDGWKPLCDFLGVPVPSFPFPHKNKRGKVLDEMKKENPLMGQLVKEFKIVLACFCVALAVGGYVVVQCLNRFKLINF